MNEPVPVNPQIKSDVLDMCGFGKIVSKASYTLSLGAGTGVSPETVDQKARLRGQVSGQ